MASRRSRSERMQSLVSLADSEAKGLAVQMQRQALIVGEDESRIAQLEGYLASYASTRMEDAAGQGVSAIRMAETHLFIERLQQAVDAQLRSVELARVRHESLRAQWIAKHLRTTALGNAVNRFRLEEAQDSSRQEQRTQDEMAARHHERRKKARDTV